MTESSSCSIEMPSLNNDDNDNSSDFHTEIGSVSPLEYTLILQSVFNVKPAIEIEYSNIYPDIFKNHNMSNDDILYNNKSISPITPTAIWIPYNSKTYLEYYKHVLDNIELICVRYFNFKLNAGKHKNFSVIHINSQDEKNNINPNQDNNKNELILFKCHPCIIYELSDRFIVWLDKKIIIQKIIDFMSLYFLFESNSKSVKFDLKNESTKQNNDTDYKTLKRSLDVDLGGILGLNSYSHNEYNYNVDNILKELENKLIGLSDESMPIYNNEYRGDYENATDRINRIDNQEKKDFFEVIQNFISENNSHIEHNTTSHVDDISLMKANHDKHALTICLYLLLNKSVDLFQIYQSKNYTLNTFKSSIPNISFNFLKNNKNNNTFNKEINFMSDFQ